MKPNNAARQSAEMSNGGLAWFVCLALAVLLDIGTARAGTVGYYWTPIIYPGAAATNTAAWGINDSGEVVGSFSAPGQPSSAFLDNGVCSV